MIPSLLLVFTFIALGLPTAVLFIPLRLITGNLMPLYNAAMGVVRSGFWMGGVRVHVEGMESIPPNTACIFMANHVSNLDPPVLLPLIPNRTTIFLKSSLMKIPVLGYAMRLAEFIPVNRDRNVQAAQDSVRLGRDLLARGIHITTFVEGTRSPDGRMLPFKKGPFYLAMETGAPCIPISIFGTETMMRKGSLRLRPGKATVIFHPPVFPSLVADRDGLMEAVRQSIAAGLPEWMRT